MEMHLKNLLSKKKVFNYKIRLTRGILLDLILRNEIREFCQKLKIDEILRRSFIKDLKEYPYVASIYKKINILGRTWMFKSSPEDQIL